jgi:predicted CopG family antitoxin
MQTTLSNTLVETKKKEAIKAQSLTKRISTGDLKLVDEGHVEINGMTIKITKDAYKGLVKSLDLPQSFTSKLDRLFNSKSKIDFINTLSRAIATLGTKSLNVILSPISKTIVGFTKSSSIITNESFFKLSDRIIDGQGFQLVDMNVNPVTGGVSMNAMLDAEHNIKSLTNEAFKTGLTISNNPNTGIQVSPYINRLWCANGCTTQMAKESYELNDLSVQGTSKFFEHINSLRKTNFIPEGYGDKVRSANNTKASIAEVNRAFNLIKPFVGERAESIIPRGKNYDAYGKMGVDLNEKGVDKKMAESNQSIWSLVNAITWTATNSDKVLENNIQDKDRVNLQIAGGNLLDSKYHLANTMKSPFSGGLNPNDQIGAILN